MRASENIARWRFAYRAYGLAPAVRFAYRAYGLGVLPLPMGEGWGEGIWPHKKPCPALCDRLLFIQLHKQKLLPFTSRWGYGRIVF